MNWRPCKSKTRGAALASALFTFTILGLCSTKSQADIASEERGRDLARLLCAKCHNLSSSGESPNAKAPPFRSFLQKLTGDGIEDELAEGILLGHQPMPKWEFSGQQIYDLSNFIISLGE